jgi:hypothetical protein
MKKNWKSVLGYTVAFLSITFITVGVIDVLNNASCAEKSLMMGFSSNYNWQTGCMIKTDKGWIPINQYYVLVTDKFLPRSLNSGG